MKCLLVTSSLTFVPENYDDFVVAMLARQEVTGLLELQNRDPGFLAKAFALILTGAGPRMGLQIYRNWFGPSSVRREKFCVEKQKSFLRTQNLHDPATLEWIRQQNFDLILNARTRTIFKKVVLNMVPLGCLNIHHGLLPEQRGLMCDFWAHLDGSPAGFSVHVMTPKLDDGPILQVSEVKTSRKNYLESLRAGARQEAIICAELLAYIARNGIPEGRPNRSENAIYRRNRGLKDFYRMAFKGIKR